MIKKILYTISAIILSFSVVQIACASNANTNLCNLTWNALQYSGFSEHASYTVDSIRKLLTRAGVVVDLTGWDPGQIYELTYSCKVEHGVTYPSLIASPIHDASAMPGIITWDATPPAS